MPSRLLSCEAPLATRGGTGLGREHPRPSRVGFPHRSSKSLQEKG